jgi:hypothetical protein
LPLLGYFVGGFVLPQYPQSTIAPKILLVDKSIIISPLREFFKHILVMSLEGGTISRMLFSPTTEVFIPS